MPAWTVLSVDTCIRKKESICPGFGRAYALILIPLKFKYGHAVGRQMIAEGIRKAVALTLLRFVDKRLLPAAAAELCGIAVQYQTVLFLFRHPYPVVLPLHGSEIADKQQIPLSLIHWNPAGRVSCSYMAGVFR